MENLKLSKEDEWILDDGKVYLCKSNGYYRLRGIGNSYIYLHRFIMNAKKGDVVDHINRDKSDNRRENLRIVTTSLNNYNKEIENKLGRGIYFDKSGNRFRACISVNNKTLKLGSSKDINIVKEIYNKKALELYGTDAYQHVLN